MRRLHLALTGLWAATAVPTLTLWRDSILWVAFMSLYANVVGHWSAYQAARAEEASPAQRRADTPQRRLRSRASRDPTYLRRP